MSERNPKFRWLDEFTRRAPKTGAIYRVGIAGANHDNGDGKGFHMSAERATEETPYGLRTCKDAIRYLMDSGWWVRTRRGGRLGDGTAVASEYVLAIPDDDGLKVQRTALRDDSLKVQDSRLKVQSSASQSAEIAPQGAEDCTPVDPFPVDPSSRPSSIDQAGRSLGRLADHVEPIDDGAAENKFDQMFAEAEEAVRAERVANPPVRVAKAKPKADDGETADEVFERHRLETIRTR